MPQDYDKIFASGATSTQDWTDENYLRGWGYLGQTPPPYQLFDALFKRLDLKTQELKSGQDNISSNYVPLAGGVMTGLLSLFTGSTVPTPNSNDNSKKIPNTEWVQTWIKAYVAELSENLEVQWSGSTFTVPALGITGLMAQNGYISLGKLFGGLILQWGNTLNIVVNASIQQLIFPITVKSVIGAVATIQRSDIPDVVICPYLTTFSQNSMGVTIDYETGKSFTPGTDITNVVWVALCI